MIMKDKIQELKNTRYATVLGQASDLGIEDLFDIKCASVALVANKDGIEIYADGIRYLDDDIDFSARRRIAVDLEDKRTQTLIEKAYNDMMEDKALKEEHVFDFGNIQAKANVLGGYLKLEQTYIDREEWCEYMSVKRVPWTLKGYYLSTHDLSIVTPTLEKFTREQMPKTIDATVEMYYRLACKKVEYE